MSIFIHNNHEHTIQLDIIGFSGGERHVQLPDSLLQELDSVNMRADIRNSNDLMDLLLTVNALRHQHGDDFKINLELPYLPYARQDRVCAPGQAFSLEVMADLLKSLKLASLRVWDCHSSVGIDLTGATNVEPADIIEKSEKLLKIMQNPNSVLICPDKGAVPRCTKIKEQLNLKEMVLCEKNRDPVTGKINRTDVIVSDLTGKTAVITDDICDGGFTFVKIAEQLKEKNADKIILFVTHGIFSKGLTVFDDLLDQVFTTNSFPRTEIEKNNKKLNIIDYKYVTGEKI